MPGRSSVHARVLSVDDAGITVATSDDGVLDVRFDDRRIFSFWLGRDTVEAPEGRFLAWPDSLHKFLHGTTEVTVALHESGEELFRSEVTLGAGGGRIAVVNDNGQPLALDKSGRATLTFETRTAEQVGPLLDSIQEVLDALKRAGIDAFLAYGTALGAVREGKLIGHDSDADLGYVSSHDHPVDVIRESFRLQRDLAAMGYAVTRYSAIAFKVDVVESDGSVRGLDVFGGFLRDGYFHLMGEIRTPFEREWIFPLGTASLEGREFPVPADTDRFLSATYGPHWRRPDPAFKFVNPRSTNRRLDGWFRGVRVGRPAWDRRYSQAGFGPNGPSDLVRWVREREPEIGTFVDIGCGRGQDVGFMVGEGVPSVGLDFTPKAYKHLAAQLADNDLATFTMCNLLEIRHVLAVSAWVARKPAPRVVMARHLAEVVGRRGRDRLWRAAGMMLRGGSGRFYLEFLVRSGSDDYAKRNQATPLNRQRIRQELEAAGASIVHESVHPVAPGENPSQVCRLVAIWE